MLFAAVPVSAAARLLRLGEEKGGGERSRLGQLHRNSWSNRKFPSVVASLLESSVSLPASCLFVVWFGFRFVLIGFDFRGFACVAEGVLTEPSGSNAQAAWRRGGGAGEGVHGQLAHHHTTACRKLGPHRQLGEPARSAHPTRNSRVYLNARLHQRSAPGHITRTFKTTERS